MNSFNLPNLEDMTAEAAITWYTGEIAKVTRREARVNGIYSDEYLQSLFAFRVERTPL